MILPLILLLLAALFAAVVAYGTEPTWGQYQHGLTLITWSRRLQWPLLTLAVLLCITLIVLIIVSKYRAWWLLGLTPILALFAHRFVTGPANRPGYAVLDNPTFVAADQASTFLRPSDYVVGVTFDGQAFAYPFAQLYAVPVVAQASREQRLLLIWSCFANRAIAYAVARELKPAELEVVSMPANALLLYNTRLGQFINGLTGQTPKGEKPVGFLHPLEAAKVPWSVWQQLHPDTRVWAFPVSTANAPTAASVPRYALPKHANPPAAATGPVAMVASTQPIAVSVDAITANPVNVDAGTLPVFLYRDKTTGVVKAFDRTVEADLRPKFRANTDPKFKAAFVDADTETGWSASGTAIEGKKEFLGKKLKPVAVEDGLDWSIMKYWYPALQWVDAAKEPPPPAVEIVVAPTEKPKATTRRTARPKKPAPKK